MNEQRTSSDFRAVPVPAPRPYDRRGYVYFITDEAAIKIGFSVDVESRRGGLQQHAPLRVLAFFPGTRDDERAVLDHFAHLLLRGEWFQPSPEITDFIAELEKGRRQIVCRRATITDATKDRLREIIAVDNIPAAKRAYFEWFEKQTFTDAEIQNVAYRCKLDIQCLDWNRKHLSKVMVTAAAAEFAKLEQLLGRAA